MAWLGSACLVAGLLTALYAVGAALYGGHTGRREFTLSARRAIYCLAGLMLVSMVLLEAAYVRTDLSYSLVAQNSSTDTPTFYKLTAMWSSQAGSLLLWVFLLSVFSSAVLWVTRNSLRELVPYAVAVLGGVAVFFIGLMVFYESPFATLANAPAQGAGLNPLLRHPAMMFHPPMLYTGYVGFTIPFAFMVGALVTRRADAEWIRATRRFALIAWTFLGFGILLGSLWSFAELGWGGYWAWDPVENASLMPWLVGTAFIHSIMVQEKRGMLKVWNASLIAATFVLALTGTFLVRSGILDSIHAFGASTLGRPFLIFISIVILGSVALIVSRLPSLKSEGRIESIWSREAVFLLNNLVLVGLCFVIFWGTFFPLISEALTGDKASVGPPWFNRYVTPLAIVLALLSGIGPMFAWRKVSPKGLRRTFAVPLAVAAGAFVLLALFTNASERPAALAMFTITALVLAVVGQELWRGTSARRVITGERLPIALSRLIGRNRRRYGGYIVHAGIAVLFLGVAASSAFVTQRDVRLSPGQTTKVAGYEITYVKPTAGILSDRANTGAPITLGAILRVKKAGETWVMHPSRNFYPATDGGSGVVGRFFEGEATSEVDLRWGLRRDLWTAVQPDLSRLQQGIKLGNQAFANAEPAQQAAAIKLLAESYAKNPPPAPFRFIDSPLVSWIWLGGAIVMMGALIALWPSPEARRRRVTSLYAARLGRDLTRA